MLFDGFKGFARKGQIGLLTGPNIVEMLDGLTRGRHYEMARHLGPIGDDRQLVVIKRAPVSGTMELKRRVLLRNVRDRGHRNLYMS